MIDCIQLFIDVTILVINTNFDISYNKSIYFIYSIYSVKIIKLHNMQTYYFFNKKYQNSIWVPLTISSISISANAGVSALYLCLCPCLCSKFFAIDMC